MMCYKDRTYCISKGCQNKCGRKLTDLVKEGAERWWGSKDAPIAVAEFCDAKGEPL